jgi:hypothetical protein
MFEGFESARVDGGRAMAADIPFPKKTPPTPRPR